MGTADRPQGGAGEYAERYTHTNHTTRGTPGQHSAHLRRRRRRVLTKLEMSSCWGRLNTTETQLPPCSTVTSGSGSLQGWVQGFRAWAGERGHGCCRVNDECQMACTTLAGAPVGSGRHPRHLGCIHAVPGDAWTKRGAGVNGSPAWRHHAARRGMQQHRGSPPASPPASLPASPSAHSPRQLHLLREASLHPVKLLL